jgi:integral membrane protein (TIGR01906 family)
MTRWKSSSGSCKPLAVLLILTLPILILLGSFHCWMYDARYAEQQFEVNRVYLRLDKETVNYENENLFNYLESGTGILDTDFFNTKEVSHLNDVHIVMQNASIMFLMLSLFWIIGAVILHKKIFKVMYKGALLSILLFAVVGFIAFNFEFAFTQFHNIFFSAGTWTFEPTEHLVMMYTTQFFYNITRNILLTFGGISVIIMVLSRSTYTLLGHRKALRQRRL